MIKTQYTKLNETASKTATRGASTASARNYPFKYSRLSGKNINRQSDRDFSASVDIIKQYRKTADSLDVGNNQHENATSFDKNIGIGVNLPLTESSSSTNRGEERQPLDSNEPTNKPEDEDRIKVTARAFDAFKKLPIGEIKKIADTAEKRTLKWEGVIKIAPELYQDRPRREDLPRFLERVYNKLGHLDGKLTTAHIAIIDPPLGDAIKSWNNHHGSVPAEFNLPTSKNRPKGTGMKNSQANKIQKP